jgi:hypothetical protein
METIRWASIMTPVKSPALKHVKMSCRFNDDERNELLDRVASKIDKIIHDNEACNLDIVYTNGSTGITLNIKTVTNNELAEFKYDLPINVLEIITYDTIDKIIDQIFQHIQEV